MNVSSASYEAALALAALGYKVFPLQPYGKRPACPHGFKDATTDESTIDRWWTESPDYNIGLATDSLLVVDVDGDNNPWPLDPERALELAVAPFARTQSGGRHYFFRQPEGENVRCSAGRIADNVDIRADGGYVVVPPSVGENGKYTWANPLDVGPEALPLPPQWLIDSLSVPAGSGTRALANTEFPEGERNSQLTRLAGEMHRHGSSATQIYEKLLETNQEKCYPPLDEREVSHVAASVGRFETELPATDLGNARRVVHHFGGQICYVTAWKQWFVWNGSRWARDEIGQVARYVQEAVRRIHDEARDADDSA